jgi:hypothetical protein
MRAAVAALLFAPAAGAAEPEPPAAERAGEAAAKPTEPPAAQSHGIPLSARGSDWDVSLYGFAEVDGIYDSTQSFNDSVLNNTLVRTHTYAGDNPRTQFTVRNSRLGLDLRAPTYGAIRTSSVVEMDFSGAQASVTENDTFTAPIVRLRHFYVKVESPAINVLVGQYHDLFGWGGAGFYPNTVAFLPVLGQVYHRNAQLRLSEVIESRALGLELAVAAVRPVQRDSATPDVQAGIKLAVNGWKGASTPGANRPTTAPLAVGISGIARRLSVTDFSQTPGNQHVLTASGAAGDVFLPVVPARGDDLSNALSVTLEATTGNGISDLYPGLTGGVQFPTLPNPNGLLPVPVYVPNIDNGIATYDAYGQLHTINWKGLIVNAHYHLPFGEGKRVWISGTYSMIESNNDVQLTPVQGTAFVWSKGTYADGNLWVAITPALQVGLSFQTVSQTFGDGLKAHNNRGEGACYFFF